MKYLIILLLTLTASAQDTVVFKMPTSQVNIIYKALKDGEYNKMRADSCYVIAMKQDSLIQSYVAKVENYIKEDAIDDEYIYGLLAEKEQKEIELQQIKDSKYTFWKWVGDPRTWLGVGFGVLTGLIIK